jgi:hypothetical protein
MAANRLASASPARQARVVNDLPEPLVFGLFVRDQIARYELVVQLPQRHDDLTDRVFVKNGDRLVDDLQRRTAELYRFVCDFHGILLLSSGKKRRSG